MFKVQYRKLHPKDLHGEEASRWYDWSDIGRFETILSAKIQILNKVYLNNYNKYENVSLENFQAVHCPDQGDSIESVFQLMGSTPPSTHQFRFIRIRLQSPWIIGLKESLLKSEN